MSVWCRCNTTWGWACDCGAMHDRETCNLNNCERCWDAESAWLHSSRIIPIPGGGAEAFWRCRGFHGCGWLVSERDGLCEECSE